MAWMTGWSYRRPIYANTSAIAATSANIPLPILLSGLVDLTGKVQADFDDAVVTDADGTTLLDYYWEVKTAAAGVGTIKVPSLTHGEAALLIGYLYYGKADAVDQSDQEGTFSSLIARYALSEGAGVLPLDSTANSYDATADLADRATGKIGNGFDYELDNADFTTLPASNLLIPNSASYYISAWAKLESAAAATTRAVIFARSAVTSNFAGFGFRDSTPVARLVYPSGTGVASASGATPLSTGVWYHLAYSKVGTGNILYLNGIEEITATAAFTLAPSAHTGVIGMAGDTGAKFDGVIDEVRIGAAKSVSWALAEYMAGAGTLLSFGVEETPAAGTHPYYYRMQAIG